MIYGFFLNPFLSVEQTSHHNWSYGCFTFFLTISTYCSTILVGGPQKHELHSSLSLKTHQMHNPATPRLSCGQVVTCAFAVLWNRTVASRGGAVFEADAKLELHCSDAHHRDNTFVVKSPTSDPSRLCGGH